MNDAAYSLDFDVGALGSTELGRALSRDLSIMENAQKKKINQHTHRICYTTSHYFFQTKAVENWQPLAYQRNRGGMEFIPLIEVGM